MLSILLVAITAAPQQITFDQFQQNVRNAYKAAKTFKEEWTLEVSGHPAYGKFSRIVAGKKFRTSFSSMQETEEQGYDGKTSFQVFHASKIYELVDGELPSSESDSASHFFSFKPIGEGAIIGLSPQPGKLNFVETRLGAEAARVATIPFEIPGSTNSTLRIWVGAKDWIVRRMEISGKNPDSGEFRVTTKVNFKSGVKVTDDTFRLSKDKQQSYKRVYQEDAVDVTHKDSNGITIMGECDEHRTRSIWASFGLDALIVPASNYEFQAAVTALSRVFGRYPKGFLKKYIDEVVIVKGLTTHGIKYGGTYAGRTLFVTAGTDHWVEQVFHHEFSSFLLNTHTDKFPSDKWKAANGAEYLTMEVFQKEQNNVNWWEQPADLQAKGFLRRYSQTEMENDLNTIAEALLMGSIGLEEAARLHPALAAKVAMVKQFYGQLDPYFSDSYFNKLLEPTTGAGAWTSSVVPPSPQFGDKDMFTLSLPLLRAGSQTDYVNVKMLYPSTGTKLPIILVAAEREETPALEPLLTEWAKRGYAVAFVNPALNSKVGETWMGSDAVELSNILKGLGGINQRLHADGQFNTSQVFLVGFGGASDAALQVLLRSQDKVRGIYLHDPIVTGKAGAEEEFAKVTLPMMLVGWNRDGTEGLNGDLMPTPFLAGPNRGDRFAVWISSFMKVDEKVKEEEKRKLQELTSVAFFDTYLKKDPKAREFLRTSAVSSLSKLAVGTFFR